MQFMDTVDERWWWDIVRRCPYATFFHTPLWHRLASETYEPYESVPIGGVCDNGTRVVLPVLYKGTVAGGLLHRYASTFAGCYGGYVADGTVPRRDRKELFDAVRSWRLGSFHLIGNPRLKEDWSGVLGPALATDDVIHVVNLKDGFDAVVSNYGSSRRRGYRRGLRLGVEVRVAQTLDDYRAYYHAYQASLRRWGDRAIARYPWRLFENGYHLGRDFPESMKLWLAEVEERVVAGVWVFYANDWATAWSGAAYSDFLNPNPA